MRLRELGFLSRVLGSLRGEARARTTANSSASVRMSEDHCIDQVTNSIRRRVAIFGSGVLLGLLLAGVAVVLRNSRASETAPVATLIGHSAHRHGAALEAINTMFPDVPPGCVECPGRMHGRDSSATRSSEEGAPVPSTTAACAFFVKG